MQEVFLMQITSILSRHKKMCIMISEYDLDEPSQMLHPYQHFGLVSMALYRSCYIALLVYVSQFSLSVY